MSRFFRGWGLLVLCTVAGGFCLAVVITSGGGECLHTTGLCFGRFVTMSPSVLYRRLRELRFQILRWVCQLVVDLVVGFCLSVDVISF